MKRLTCLLLVLALGCGGESDTRPGTVEPDPDPGPTPTVDVGPTPEPDPGPAPDDVIDDVALPPDVPEPEEVAVEDPGPTEDPGPAEDPGPPPEDLPEPLDEGPDTPDTGPEPGTIGTTCTEDAECASGICLQGPDYAMCSALCGAYACPEGWECKSFPGGAKACVPSNVCVDADEDDYGVGKGCDGPTDCDDGNAAINPGEPELCDGVDQDCDGLVDEEVTNACGACGPTPEEICNGYDDDCNGLIDDGVANACGGCGDVPKEVCNGFDDDCDGELDDGLSCGDCVVGATEPCYDGPAEALGNPPCQMGARTCTEDGTWGPCEGAVLPAEELCNDGVDDDCDGEGDDGLINACGACAPAPVEVCNGIDDDCDGQADEGVQSKCGGCAPCGEALFFPGETGVPDPAVAPAPDGGITLGAGKVERNFIWVPNSDEDTVSRWDTKTGREIARYWIGEWPSRTAIDLNGNAWIGNRGDGRATHIFSDAVDCIDRNGDGVIQTSRDLNDDGRITYGELVNDPADVLADECVHCQVALPNTKELIRGLAVDADNFAWLGTWNDKEIHKIDPETCEVLLTIPTNFEGGALPIYGLAVDGNGYMWTSNLYDDCLLKVDTKLGIVVARVCNKGLDRYGMALDGTTGKVWFADLNSGVASYDPAEDLWSLHTEPTGALKVTTGIVVDTDGVVYVAGYNSHHVGRYEPKTDTWQLFSINKDLPAGVKAHSSPRGVTIDQEGHLWAIARGSSGLVEMTKSGEILGAYDIRAADNPKAGTGPYSYSDNTGFQLFNFTATEGAWRHVFDAGALVDFVLLAWTPVLPAGTSITVEVRASETAAGLADAVFSAPMGGPKLDLGALIPPQKRFLEMRFVLKTDDPKAHPVLRDIQVFFETKSCKGDGATACPDGQLCDPVFGGCVVVPIECSSDAACKSDEYCDGAGFCHQGCRTTPDNCALGSSCNPASHLCQAKPSECGTDAECAVGTWCSAVQTCEPGCRLSPDSCPPQFACNAETHDCDPLPPECSADLECPADEYCGSKGQCLTGCRTSPDTCEVGLLCHAADHQCVPVPEACDPTADPQPLEVCNGVDDDCDGLVDEEIAEVGETCPVGDKATGNQVCTTEGALLCRANASPDQAEPVVLAGKITNVQLPAAPYVVPENVWMEGRIEVEPGATITNPGPDPRWMQAYAQADVRIIGATIMGLSLKVNGGNSQARVEGSTIEGLVGKNNRVEFTHAGPLVLRASTVKNTEVVIGKNCVATVELCTLSSDDAYQRWTFSSWGLLTLKHTEIRGANTVPRAQYGAKVYGPSDITTTVFAKTQVGLLLEPAADVPVTVLGCTAEANDIGFRLRKLGFPTLIDNVVDDLDVGHVGVGVHFEDITPGGGATIQGTIFRLDPGDAAVWLEPDCFAKGSPTVLTGSVFEGAGPETRYWLSGTGKAPELALGLLDQASDYRLRNHVHLQSSTVTLADGLAFHNVHPQWGRSFQLTYSSTLTATAPSFTNVTFDVTPTTSAVVTGGTFTDDTDKERRLIYSGGDLTLSNALIASTNPTEGKSRLKVGLEVNAEGSLLATGVTFSHLRAALFVQDDASATLDECTFAGNQTALWPIEKGEIIMEGGSISEKDEALVATGIYGWVGQGGVLDIADVTFDMTPEDTPVILHPHTFHEDSPSKLSGLVLADGSTPAPLALQGTAEGGTYLVGDLGGGDTYRVRENVVFRKGAQATLQSGLSLWATAWHGRRIYVQHEGTVLTVESGVAVTDMSVDVWGPATANLDGTAFSSTTTHHRDHLYCSGICACTDCSFTGFQEKQGGIYSDYAAQVTLTNPSFTNLSYAYKGIRDSVTTLENPQVSSTLAAGLLEASATLIVNGGLVSDASPERVARGYEARKIKTGASLQITDLAFDIGPEDVAYAFELGMFRDDATLAIAGSTFANDEQGIGYRLLSADYWDPAPLLVQHVEPAQTSWVVTGNFGPRGDVAHLTIADGTVFTNDGYFRVLRSRDNTTMTVGAATFDAVGLYYENKSSGVTTGATFTTTSKQGVDLARDASESPVTFVGCTVVSLTEGNATLGIRIYALTTTTSTVANSSFTGLKYGIYQDAAAEPVLTDNTFVDCLNDLFVK